MSTPRHRSAVDTLLGALVHAVRVAAARRRVLSTIGLSTALVVGVAYLTFGILAVNPFESSVHVRISLAQSGGLLPGQDVTQRGIRIGRVESVDLDEGGVVAITKLDGTARIPRTSSVKVSSLSAAGEQYLDFRPDSDEGPYLADGDTVEQGRTTTPVTLASVLTNANGLVRQVDPQQVNSIVRELGVSEQGPDKLAAVIDGGSFLISTLDSVLPQTVSLLNNSKVVLGTLSEMSPGIESAAQSLGPSLGGIASMTEGFKTMLADGPPAWQAMDHIIADNSPTMVQLLGNLVTNTQMLQLRVPAIRELFFPSGRSGSVLEALASTFHDGKLWGIANIYPRYVCDKNIPRIANTDASFPEPHMYAYCTDPDPTVLTRGARNAPRPDGVAPPSVPPGADPLQTTDPAPISEYSFPTPDGGAHVP